MNKEWIISLLEEEKSQLIYYLHKTDRRAPYFKVRQMRQRIEKINHDIDALKNGREEEFFYIDYPEIFDQYFYNGIFNMLMSKQTK